MSSIAGNRKIKVAYVLTPIDFGGAEKVSLNFLKSFDRDKFEIVPFLLIRPWEDKVYFTQEIEKHKINYLTIPVAIKPLKEGRDYFRIVRCYQRLFAFLKEGKFDIIHTHGYFADILGVPIAKIFRIPHLTTCHGFIQNDSKLKLYNLLDIFLLKFSNKIISVADDIKDKLISRGLIEDKIVTIPNAVILPDLTGRRINEKRMSIREKYNLKSDEVVIGYIGRLSEEKGLKYLLEAGITLSKQGIPIKIMLIGDGPERETLKALARKGGVTQHVIFTGFQEDAVKLLSALDLFVLPSLTEGTPMALLEAMSYGIPVIASEVGGIPKVITSGENGVLVTPENSTEIAKSILKLYKNNEYWMKLSDGAKNCIKEKYNLTAWVHNIESIYFDVTS